MSVRDRLERAELDRKYAARVPQKTAEQIEQERRERLAQNARKIRENQLNTMLLDMTDAEREVVFSIIGRERPECLGSAEVVSATLLGVREEGAHNLQEAMHGTTKAEQDAVWEILRNTSVEARLGMDGGAACAEALRRVRSENYLEE
ncbi:MAG: hypothetical protein ACM3WP_02155 [Acidobacteriota bacterium]